jgi:hypothetical protein
MGEAACSCGWRWQRAGASFDEASAEADLHEDATGHVAAARGDDDPEFEAVWV